MKRRGIKSNLEARLEAVYAQVPEVHCRGLCQASCGPIAMTDLEYRRLEAHRGGPVPPYTGGLRASCPLLTAAGRCSVYAVRPLICRLWAAAEGLPCPHGCAPARVLSEAESAGLLNQAAAIVPGQQIRWLLPVEALEEP